MTDHVLALPAAEVDAARVAIRDDIAAVTTVQERRIEFDDGTKRILTAPPRLTQLEAELHGGSAPVGAFSPRSKPPTGIDALSLLHLIDCHCGQLDGADRAARLWSWACAVSSAAPAAVPGHARTAAGFHAAVEALLDPLPRFRVRGQACPSCGAQKVWDRADQGAGEHHARPALEVDPHTGETRCAHCSASWAADLHEHLRAVLEQQQAETLAAGGFDPHVGARTGDEAGRGRVLRGLSGVSVRLPTGRDEDGAKLYAAPVVPAVTGPALPPRPVHAPDLSRVDPDLVQCPARVVHPEPTPTRRRRRCSSLLDVDGVCPNRDAHDWEPPSTDDDTDHEVAHGDDHA